MAEPDYDELFRQAVIACFSRAQLDLENGLVPSHDLFSRWLSEALGQIPEAQQSEVIGRTVDALRASQQELREQVQLERMVRRPHHNDPALHRPEDETASRLDLAARAYEVVMEAVTSTLR